MTTKSLNVFEEAYNLGRDIHMKVDQTKMAYMAAFSQAQNYYLKAVISNLKGHQIELKGNLRFALETSCLAAYSLLNEDISEMIKYDEQGKFDTKHFQNTQKRDMYNFIQEKFPEKSDYIKHIKNQINDFGMHANIGLTFINFDPQKCAAHYFDIDHQKNIEVTNLAITNVMLNFYVLYNDIVDKYDLKNKIKYNKEELIKINSLAEKIANNMPEKNE